MGKPSKSTKKTKRVILKTPTLNGTSLNPSTQNASIEQLLRQASEHENEFETDKSLKLYNRVLARLEDKLRSAESGGTSSGLNGDEEKQYRKALQSSAFTSLELGKPARAKTRLLQLLKRTTDVDYEVFMYLAQLSQGQESLDYYRRGLEALSKITNHDATLSAAVNNSSTKSVQSLQRAESNAFCAIAELYMTDLCDLPEAETECQRAFDTACQTDPTNPQAWLTSANYHNIRCQTESCREAIQRCLAPWWFRLEKFLADEDEAERKSNGEVEGEEMRSIGDEGVEAVEPNLQSAVIQGEHPNDRKQTSSKLDLEELTEIPSSGLISLARIMIELEMWEKCATLLEALLEEEEGNLEIYYLLTVVGRHLWLQDDPDVLRYYATTARVIAGKIGDVEMADEMSELLNELPESADSSADDDDEALDEFSTSDEEDGEDARESSSNQISRKTSVAHIEQFKAGKKRKANMEQPMADE